MRLNRRSLRRLTAVRDWALWSLPRWLAVFVLTIVAVYVAAIGVAVPFTSFSEHDLILFGVLVVVLVGFSRGGIAGLAPVLGQQLMRFRPSRAVKTTASGEPR